jgi:hypothetical protein
MSLLGYAVPSATVVLETYRIELALAFNQHIEMALEHIRTQVKIDESIISWKQANKLH